VTIVDVTGPVPVQRVAKDAEAIVSSVLPALETTAFRLFRR
jgi:hypothetical protein